MRRLNDDEVSRPPHSPSSSRASPALDPVRGRVSNGPVCLLSITRDKPPRPHRAHLHHLSLSHLYLLGLFTGSNRATRSRYPPSKASIPVYPRRACKRQANCGPSWPRQSPCSPLSYARTLCPSRLPNLRPSSQLQVENP